MRSLIIRLFILLGLIFPALASAAVASYVGSYSGTYSGGDSGTWVVTVSSAGGVTGTSHSNSTGLNYTVSGQVLANGSLSMSAGTTSSGATFTGSINSATGGITGTWSNSFYGISGAFSGTGTTSVVSYAGNYSGTYSGGDSGTWAVAVSSAGGVTGTSHSSSTGLNYTVSGQASFNGSLSMTAGAISSGAAFTGLINLATGGISGTWSNSFYGISGTFSGTGTTSKASQTIGAISFSPTTLTVGSTTTTSATATSGLAVSLSSTTPNICTVSGSTVTGIAAGTCTLAANQAGNASYNAATQVTQSIIVANSADTIAPTVPTGLTATPASSSQMNLGWTASTDNAGVTSYKVYRNGTQVGSPAGTIYNDTGMTASTLYSYTVAACDAAANCSAQSNTVSATTSASGATGGTALNFVTGWNLVGNSVNASLDVATALGDTTKVTTVWKWVPATSKWTFYTPLQADGGAAYAATKGFDFLTTINAGEGFWVNAKAGFTVQLPAGSAISTGYFQEQFDPIQNKLITGWNLIATGDNVTPSAFNKALSVMPPAQGVIPINVTTLWAWDSALSNWYFYAPSLEANGGLVNYITTKSYLDFTAASKLLGQGVGFWVNKP